MSEIVVNKFMKYATDMPAAMKLTARPRERTMKYAELLTAIKAVGPQRAITLSTAQMAEHFGPKEGRNALVYIRVLGRKMGMKIKIINVDGKWVFTHAIREQELYKQREDGTFTMEEKHGTK